MLEGAAKLLNEENITEIVVIDLYQNFLLSCRCNILGTYMKSSDYDI